jgi:hypothetical protein
MHYLSSKLQNNLNYTSLQINPPLRQCLHGTRSRGAASLEFGRRWAPVAERAWSLETIYIYITTLPYMKQHGHKPPSLRISGPLLKFEGSSLILPPMASCNPGGCRWVAVGRSGSQLESASLRGPAVTVGLKSK